MRIDRNRVLQRFKEYTDAYDASDEKIALKIRHTYRVAGLCEQIARSEKRSEEEQSLAWLLGMLHDVGRFEQLRRYDTFSDADSVDHAQLGADILFAGNKSGAISAADIGCGHNGALATDAGCGHNGALAADAGCGHNGAFTADIGCGRNAVLAADAGEGGMIREWIEDASEDALIETAVRVHSAYRVPEGLDERTELFCHILRDADKIDILRVNIETPLEEIYNTTKEALYHAEVSNAVMESFYERHATLRSIKRTPVDHIAGHVSLIYELVFPESFRIVQEQGYWKKLIGFPSENPKTVGQLQALCEAMEKFLAEKER